MRPENASSRRLPGGDLVAAVFDRNVMTFADKGGASNLIGDRWADLAAAHAASWAGSGEVIERFDQPPVPIMRVDRLDASPRIAAEASKRGMQNPDLLLIGQDGVGQALQAADAKFSVETARSKQVSVEVVVALLSLRDRLPELLPGLSTEFEIEPGLFLCPDYLLTHLMLDTSRKPRRGILRTSVSPHEVVLVPVSPEAFWQNVEGSSVMAPLAELDDLAVRPENSLLAGVYYFRLARAAVGFWLDANKPLLLFNDVVSVDEAAIYDEAVRRQGAASSAIDLIWQWDSDVQAIRNQRASVEHVSSLPIPGRDLRPTTARIAAALGVEPPSANQVRRRLGAWYRSELRQRVGPVQPPVDNLPTVLRHIAEVAQELAPRVEQELVRVVREIAMETAAREENEAVRTAANA